MWEKSKSWPIVEKKPRQIVELSEQTSQGLILSLWLPLLLSAIYATPFRACVSLHKCRTRVVTVGGSRWGNTRRLTTGCLTWKFSSHGYHSTRVNPLMLIHGGLGSTCWRFSLRLIHGRGRGKQHIDKFGNLFTTDYPAKEMNMNGNTSPIQGLQGPPAICLDSYASELAFISQEIWARNKNFNCL